MTVRDALTFLDGKKTYIIAAITIATSALQYFGYTIPEFVWGILGAAGLGTMRLAVSKIAKGDLTDVVPVVARVVEDVVDEAK